MVRDDPLTAQRDALYDIAQEGNSLLQGDLVLEITASAQGNIGRKYWYSIYRCYFETGYLQNGNTVYIHIL